MSIQPHSSTPVSPPPLLPPARLFNPSPPHNTPPAVASPNTPQLPTPLAAGSALPTLAFEAAPTLDEVKAGAVLEANQSGPIVTELQTRLTQLGFGVAATGTFGPTTQVTLQAFQRTQGIEPTGRFGPTTLQALEQAEKGGALAKKIAQQAEQIARQRDTVGQCYEAVAEAIETHISPFLWGMSAWMAADQLAASSAFREIPLTGADLPTLPAGTIVVWEKGSSPHGHISVALGDGREASDHIAEQMTSHYGGGKARAFVAK